MNVAFIPVRGGSKSIPLKNIKLICGKPLVYWVVKAACRCRYIDKVYVASDSDIIRKTVEEYTQGIETDFFSKVVVIERSTESASDMASTELAMLEFADKFEFDNIVLIQATSPLLVSTDLDKGFEVFAQEGTDSVLSVVRQKRFHWCNDEKGFAHSTNYDVFHRPRRQEFNGYMVENGAFYITSKLCLLESQNRISGNIRVVEMNEDTFFEIDEPSDWVIIEALMQKKGIEKDGLKSRTELREERLAECKNSIVMPVDKKEVLSQIPEIKMLLTDCDGCLTDGGMYYSEHGDELKKFNTRDGMAFSILKSKGILTGIITSESADLNRRRAEKMKVDILESGCKDKAETVKKVCEEYGIDLENVAYIGDDINDLDVIKIVGFGCCPADAILQVKEVARYIAKVRGGEGVVREVVESILMNSENIGSLHARGRNA